MVLILRHVQKGGHSTSLNGGQIAAHTIDQWLVEGNTFKARHCQIENATAQTEIQRKH